MSFTPGSTGILLTGGSQIGAAATGIYNLSVRDLDNTDGKQIALGGTYFNAVWYTYQVNTDCITSLNGAIFVLNSDGYIYKLDSHLNILAKAAWPSDYALALYADIWGRLVIVNQDWTSGQEDVFYYMDDDLNVLGNTDGLYSLLFQNWDSAAGGSYIRTGRACYYPGIVGSTTVASTRDAAGNVQSVAVIPGDGEDEVWVAVLRTFGGATARYIERMQPRAFANQEDAFFVDSGIIYDGAETATITGLDHLEGETVNVWGDGATFAQEVVASGSITIDSEVALAHVGLPQRYKLSPMRIDIDTRDGSSAAKHKKVSKIWLSLVDSLGVKVGKDVDNLYDYNWRTVETYNSPPDMFTGDSKEIQFDGGFDESNVLLISNDGPEPCTIRAIVASMDIEGR
jgi:hypothetical protein